MARVLVYSTGDIEALVPVLADAGHRVSEAYDASEAVRLVIQGQLDVVMIPELPEPFGRRPVTSDSQADPCLGSCGGGR